jgi:hypothetical protein
VQKAYLGYSDVDDEAHDPSVDHTLADLPAVEQTQQIPAVSGGASR